MALGTLSGKSRGLKELNSSSGGVLRDRKGNWIFGYNHYLGKCSVFVVELWSILDGLKLFQKQEYNEVIIQSDNLEVVAIGNSKLEGSNSTLVKQICWILLIEEKWCLRYVPRETNKIVDAVTKMALSNDEDSHMFEVHSIVILVFNCRFKKSLPI
ncbi:hypothetical protein J1N35_033297 [Gossypium stocksii]|uniref:RNase H type-1 domain-containing protein n=1 Tax=Gossypium stocksii TaxID=47602 RepID=A0A9D3UPX1_9ROSI|nr:hypothetical protein J1N35_033297 [Gossypium stocksii]